MRLLVIAAATLTTVAAMLFIAQDRETGHEEALNETPQDAANDDGVPGKPVIADTQRLEIPSNRPGAAGGPGYWRPGDVPVPPTPSDATPDKSR